LVVCAALRARRQRVQWQFHMKSGSPVISNAISPHRQLPCVIPGLASTFGRSTAGEANSGGFSGCCGSVSVIVYQGAFEPTNR